MVSDDQVFDSMTDSEPEVDYTGLNAAHYIDKYTNRPEDQGDLQAIQSMLSTAGIVAPPADMINAAIYSVQGEWGMAALSAGAVIPILGDMHKIKKSGEKMITLYRGYPKWYAGSMVENSKFIGGHTGVHGTVSIIGAQPPKTLWTSVHYEEALNYVKTKGPIFKFKVPESYIKTHGVFKPNLTGKIPEETKRLLDAQHKYTVVAFPDGLPVKFIEKAYHNRDHFLNATNSWRVFDKGIQKGVDKVADHRLKKVIEWGK